MDIYIPSKTEWEAIQKNISEISEGMHTFKELLKKGSIGVEHFPDFMDIPTAAQYLKCPVSRIKSMIYTQKLLPIHHIDLTTTVYVSRKEINDLPFRVKALQRMQKKNDN